MPIQKSIQLAGIAERENFHRIFVGEDILSREVFTYLSVITLRTNKIGVATGITSPYVRNLAVLASGALMLQRLSGNRFDLGLGVGGIPEVRRLTGAAPRQPVEMLRETTAALRLLFGGVSVTCKSPDGIAPSRDFKLHKLDVRTPRILFGVRGPRLQALAGEVADGVILSGSKRCLPRSLHILEEGASKAGRHLEEFEKVLWLPFIEGEDSEDIDLARIVVATVIASTPQREIDMIPSLMNSESMLHLLRIGEYKAATRQMPEETVKEFCFFGSIDDILDEARKYKSLGFDELVVGPPFGRKPLETLKKIGAYGGKIR